MGIATDEAWKDRDFHRRSMTSRYPVPAGRARAELLVVNSRFIATVGPAPGVEAAKAFVAAIRQELPGASHHCYAFLVGHRATVTAGMSDDGEPAGTAGRPMLAVLRGSGLGDVVVVVTRYFGGTLLGTGGLVRAYGDAVKAVLAVLPRGERIPVRRLTAWLGYDAYGGARRALEQAGALIMREEFGVEVCLEVEAPVEAYPLMVAALETATAGHVRIEEW
jgi:uncharacterized YigZ family protein